MLSVVGSLSLWRNMTNFLFLDVGGGGCQMCRVSMNILRKHLRATDKWCSFSWGDWVKA